jgi:hypothetical protein
MELYAVKKEKHYFRGDKFEPLLIPYLLFLIGFIASICMGGLLIPLSFLLSTIVYSMFIQETFKKTSMRAYFLPTCLYQLSTNYDQVNKLFGISEGFHHWDSARIGWRCLDGEKIELLAYAYVNKKRIIKPMIKCNAQQWVFCHIENKPSKYVFKALTANGQSITVSIDKPKRLFIYDFSKLFIYRLYPYFGGQQSAPHDMSLYLIKLRQE